MRENLNRRNFLRQSIIGPTAATLGLSFEEKALLARTSGKPVVPTCDNSAKGLQMGKIGNVRISRLICGGNLISGVAHSRDLIYVSSLLRNYYTDEKIIETIRSQEVTSMFASPALLKRVGEFGKQKGIKLPSLRRVISAGAPVSPSIIEQFTSMLSGDAEIHTPYGATEAVPVISISSNEILSETRKLSEQGYGFCIGRPINDLQVRIIKISDDPINEWSEDLVVKHGEIGEITVRGDLVTRQYFERPEADALAKIKDGNTIWHRMGDLGWFDSKDRIWFCGRKSHRVTTKTKTLFTIPCESIFNNHPKVFRSALVGIGPMHEQKPIICIELEHDNDSYNKNEIKNELLELALQNELTKDIKIILFHNSFPVDIRHNSKIFREKLAVWAEKRI